MTFTIIHERIRYGNFPKDKLEEIPGVTINIENQGYSKQKVEITLDESYLDEDDTIENTIFQLGILTQMYLTH